MGRGLSASGVEQDCAVVGLAVLLFMGASGKRQGEIDRHAVFEVTDHDLDAGVPVLADRPKPFVGSTRARLRQDLEAVAESSRDDAVVAKPGLPVRRLPRNRRLETACEIDDRLAEEAQAAGLLPSNIVP